MADMPERKFTTHHRWEYKQVAWVFLSINDLNKMGKDGWELCTIHQDVGQLILATFKRQIIEVQS